MTTAVTESQSVHPHIERYLKKLEKHKAFALSLQPHAVAAQQVLDACDVSGEMLPWETVDTLKVDVIVETMGKVAELLRAFGDQGYRQTKKPYNNGTNKNYTLGIDGDDVIDLFVGFSGACRMVKVGETTVTEPVYEVKCGEGGAL